MRDLIVTENITLDGVIDATEGLVRPRRRRGRCIGRRDGASEAARGRRRAAPRRVTFEQMRGYWSPQTDDTTGITDYLNGVSK
jgi:hypothetical protein